MNVRRGNAWKTLDALQLHRNPWSNNRGPVVMLHGGEAPCPSGNIDISIRWPVDCESPVSPLLPFVWEIEHRHKLPSDRFEVNAARVSGLARTLPPTRKALPRYFCPNKESRVSSRKVSHFFRRLLSPSLVFFIRVRPMKLCPPSIMQRQRCE